MLIVFQIVIYSKLVNFQNLSICKTIEIPKISNLVNYHIFWVRRPIFRNFKISNIKRSKDELFEFSIFELILHFDICLNFSNIQNIW